MTKNVHWSSRNGTCYSGPILIKFQFSRHIFQKTSSVKFHENPYIGSRVVPSERTDRHDEDNSRF